MRDDIDLAGSVDPDVDLRVPAQRRELGRSHGAVLLVIAVGGGAGSLARYGLAEAIPREPGTFPLATFVTNVVGCVCIGVLMVLITEVWSAHRLLRPFLGVGVLGGFTTFSSHASETRALLAPGTVVLAFVYLLGTVISAMLAVALGMWIARGTARALQRDAVAPKEMP